MPRSLAWEFCTERFRVALYIRPDYAYQYDGDDPDGETQAALDSGEYMAFDSEVIVELDGVEIASDTLGGSVYRCDSVPEFWTAHRDRDPMNRNCSVMQSARGNAVICHYFPDMVVSAVADARRFLAGSPGVRAA